jgi:hypothetical protein
MGSSTELLLDTFDSAIVEKLEPFFRPLNARHSVGESCHDASNAPCSLKRRRHSDLEGRFFWWINRFVVDDTTFEIGYGDREFEIVPTMFYAGIADRFAPWELLKAAGVSEPLVMSGEAFVLTPEFAVRVIHRLGDGLRNYWDLLSLPEAGRINRALAQRAERIVLAQQEQRRIERDRASIRASSAFHAGRFAEAHRLLEPYRNDTELARSSAKLLEIAERKLNQR